MRKITGNNSNYDEITKEFSQKGVVLLSEIQNEQYLAELISRFCDIHKNTDNESITYLSATTNNTDNNQRGFTNLALYPHTDRSSIENPPNMLALFCLESNASNDGKCLLVDGYLIAKQLHEKFPDTLEKLRKPNSAIFSDGTVAHTGSIIDCDNNHFTIRFRFDQYGFFNSELIKHLDIFKRCVEENMVTFKLQRHEAYIINNRRWLHGREAFSGNRTMCRIHAETKASFKNQVLQLHAETLAS